MPKASRPEHNPCGISPNLSSTRRAERRHRERSRLTVTDERMMARYGMTTIPAYVTSLFRSQVFSYLSVAAS